MSGKWRVYWTDENGRPHWVGGFASKEGADDLAARLFSTLDVRSWHVTLGATDDE